MKSKARKVGIILINYNGLEDTIECIDSIRKSDYSNFHIYVIDNNSKQDASMLKNYSCVTYKRLDDNVGFGVANNIGAELAIRDGAQLIMCLNNDTVIEQDTISVLAAQTTDKVITTAAIYYYSNPQELWYGGGKVSKWRGTFRHKNYHNSRKITFITGCCMMLTATCYKDIGLFDPAYFMYYEDSDFSLKALKKGYQLQYVYEARVYHKVGSSSSKIVGLKDYYLTRNRLYILNKYSSFFKSTSKLYFYSTRIIKLLKNKVKRENNSFILTGISDYRKGIVGRKDGIN